MLKEAWNNSYFFAGNRKNMTFKMNIKTVIRII